MSKELAPGYYYLPPMLPSRFSAAEAFKVEAGGIFSWRTSLGRHAYLSYSGQYYPGCRLVLEGRRVPAVWVLLRFGEVAP